MPRQSVYGCGVTFINAAAKEQHARDVHSCNVTPDYCRKQFTSYHALESHVRAKHPRQCRAAECRRRIASSAGWKAHYRASPHHPHCGACGEGFQYREEVDAHRSLVHPPADIQVLVGAIERDPGVADAPLPVTAADSSAGGGSQPSAEIDSSIYEAVASSSLDEVDAVQSLRI
ncbi:hypothetical protein FIBSPDRAFT_1041257 [Athelia psychrophila]|uniref:C2H2-type domain-containing protein n=1 Tax=Athelia psychrophila TaxID=1759441 RepID=A0A166P2M9_9AGAM|nr:hypothetical protein FIBSPDRAFT_1041257 [Fibularhizoctonia sp. CBS 109695]